MGHISPTAIQEFLSRPLSDSAIAKMFSGEALDQKLASLDPPAKLSPNTRISQKVAFLLSVQYWRYLLFLQMGLGKSKVVLDLVNYHQKKFGHTRVLILVPNVTNVPTWEAQVKEHQPHLDILGSLGSAEEKTSQFLDVGNNGVISTYMGFLSRVCSSKSDVTGDPDEKGWSIDSKKVEEMASLFHMIVFDESTKLRTHNSLLTKACQRVAARIPARFALAGKPFGKDPHHVWPQFRVIDDGATLGETLGFFRAVFFTEKENYFTKWPDYVFRPEMGDTLKKMMRNRSIYYETSEVLELPELTRIKHNIVFSDEHREHYEKIVKELIEAEGNFKAVDSIYYRLRSITSGFLTVIDPEGERFAIKFKNNPKLEALVELLDELPEDSKSIVFHDYVMTGELICERLKAEKINHARIYGKTKDKPGQLKKFMEDPKCRVLVLNSESGAMGLNLQCANFMFFYESPSDPIVRDQAEKRTHRPGQLKKVFCYDLVVKKSVDQKILTALEKGQNFYDQVMKGEEKLT